MDKTAIYARVSTRDQDYDMQVAKLRKIAEAHSWDIVAEYKEKVSGGKGREQREELDKLLTAVHEGDVNRILVWSLDRLSRSVSDLINISQIMQRTNAQLYIKELGVDTSTPAGKMFYTIMGSIGEFQKAIINENVKAGIERAKEKGVKFGRPRIRDSKRERIEATLASGLSVRKTAKELKVPEGTVATIRREMSQRDPSLAGQNVKLVGHSEFRVTDRGTTRVKRIIEGVEVGALKAGLDVKVQELNLPSVKKPKRSDVA